MAYATGKQKMTEAQVTVSKASVSVEGIIVVNETSLLEVLPLIQTCQQVLFPLMLVNALGQFDVKETVQNGGSTGKLRTGTILPIVNFKEGNKSSQFCIIAAVYTLVEKWVHQLMHL